MSIVFPTRSLALKGNAQPKKVDCDTNYHVAATVTGPATSNQMENDAAKHTSEVLEETFKSLLLAGVKEAGICACDPSGTAANTAAAARGWLPRQRRWRLPRRPARLLASAN